MTDLQRILRAERALTLASVPTGFAPLLLADLARGAKGLTLYIAPDEATVKAHAEQGEFPANRVSQVRSVIDPTTAE